MGSEKNPLDEYFQEKTAVSFGRGFAAGAFGQDAGRLGMRAGKSVAQGAMGAAGALAVGAAGMGAQMLYDAATKSRDFKAMLESNPDLIEAQQEDPKRFNQMFTTLRTFNPSFSRDPLVAGGMMRQMHEAPNGIAGLMSTALDSRDKLNKNPLSEQVSRAALSRGKRE